MTIMETDVVETTTHPTEELIIEEGTWLMDPSLKQRWVTALRSGKYQQGSFSFEYQGKFCVLGVLCDVAGEPTGDVSNWPFINEAIPDKHKANTLFGMNDTGVPFSVLADYIEENL